jgi:hypothetical protein
MRSHGNIIVNPPSPGPQRPKKTLERQKSAFMSHGDIVAQTDQQDQPTGLFVPPEHMRRKTADNINKQAAGIDMLRWGELSPDGSHDRRHRMKVPPPQSQTPWQQAGDAPYGRETQKENNRAINSDSAVSAKDLAAHTAALLLAKGQNQSHGRKIGDYTRVEDARRRQELRFGSACRE